MISQKGNALVIILAIVGVLAIGYITLTKFVVPAVVNKAVNTAIDSSVNSLNFDNANHSR